MQTIEKVAKVMERPFYMNPKKAVDFGVADKVTFPRDRKHYNVIFLSSIGCKRAFDVKDHAIVYVLFQRFSVSVTYLWYIDRIADIMARSGSYGWDHEGRGMG